MRTYSCVPPYKFVLLRSRHLPERQSCMTWTKSLTTALYAVEKHALKSKWHATFLKNLVWPGSTFVREVLVGCKEAGHIEAPDDINQDLGDMVQGLYGSVPCELGFKILSNCSHIHRAGVLGRVSRWHRLLASDLCKDHDRPLADITAHSHATKASKIGLGAFDHKAAKQVFSLGDHVPHLMSSEDLPLLRRRPGWVGLK